jgi:hypothetical protein
VAGVSLFWKAMRQGVPTFRRKGVCRAISGGVWGRRLGAGSGLRDGESGKKL